MTDAVKNDGINHRGTPRRFGVCGASASNGFRTQNAWTISVTPTWPDIVLSTSDLKEPGYWPIIVSKPDPALSAPLHDERGVQAGMEMRSRFFNPKGSVSKNWMYCEQDRPDGARKHKFWKKHQGL
ncbi:hypothetical protein [Acetobacter senegalensis]|uniref:hypothetical protein n=1 Tax=Acetobacter senegalensis TaxID=446692 RepID=UPI00264C043C|nr:hypothetical protein [Acetobacter senegalensis]MDN7349831.1 hypothetical protein [Acetobacter senegalensis]